MEKNNLFEIHKYEEDWEKEIGKAFSQYKIQKHQFINIIINIILAFLCIFVFKLKIWMLPIAFIVCDVLLLPLNILLVRVIPQKRLETKNVKYLTKRNEKLTKMIEHHYCKLEKENTSFERSLIRNDIERMEDEILENNSRIEELTKEMTTVSSAYEKISKENKDKIQEVITLLSAIKISDSMKKEDIDLTSVVEKSRKIKKILDEKPEMVDFASTTFNLYGAELIKIIQAIKKMEKDEQKQYYPKIKELIYEYELHLKRLEEKIKRDDYIQTNVDINVLLSEIKKDKKGEVY